MADDVPLDAVSLAVRLAHLVDAVGSPRSEVRATQGGSLWRASMWDSKVSLEVEVDHRQGLYLLIGSVGADGAPQPGPYRDGSGRLVRMHASELLTDQAPDLSARVRSCLGSWPYPDLDAGDWAELETLCREVWSELESGWEPFA